MTDKGWGCLFAVGVFATVSIVLYWVAYLILGLFEVSELHRVAMSVLVGVAGALGLNKVVD